MDFVHVIPIEKSLQRGWRAMRLYETARDKKWTVLVFLKIGDGMISGVIVAVAFAIASEENDAVRILGTLLS